MNLVYVLAPKVNPYDQILPLKPHLKLNSKFQLLVTLVFDRLTYLCNSTRVKHDMFSHYSISEKMLG